MLSKSALYFVVINVFNKEQKKKRIIRIITNTFEPKMAYF